MTTEETCEEAKRQLHRFIDLVSDRECKEPEKLREDLNLIISNRIGHWQYEIEKAKWHETIRLMNQ